MSMLENFFCHLYYILYVHYIFISCLFILLLYSLVFLELNLLIIVSFNLAPWINILGLPLIIRELFST